MWVNAGNIAVYVVSGKYVLYSASQFVDASLGYHVQQQPIKGAQKEMIYSWFYEKIEATHAMCILASVALRIHFSTRLKHTIQNKLC